MPTRFGLHCSPSIALHERLETENEGACTPQALPHSFTAQVGCGLHHDYRRAG